MLRLPVFGSCILLALLFSGAVTFGQQPKPTPPAPEASQELMYQGEATSILGRQVTGPDDKNVGRIVDVLVADLG